MARHAMLMFLLLAFLAGCSKSGKAGMQEQAHKVKPKDSVFSTQFKEIDKAKGVQKTLMNGAAHDSREIERQAQ